MATDVTAYAFTPRYYDWEDLRLPLPGGSAVPRTSWFARLPRIEDVLIPRADGPVSLDGGSLETAGVQTGETAFTQLRCFILQRHSDGTESQLTWLARPRDLALPLVPDGVDVADLGFDPGGPAAFVRVQLEALVGVEEEALDVRPRFLIAAGELEASAMLPVR
jgi:hypothetical protein